MSDALGINELLRARREEILRLAASHGARNIRVFGSVARGETDEASDVDFLVEMEPGRTRLIQSWEGLGRFEGRQGPALGHLAHPVLLLQRLGHMPGALRVRPQ